MSKHLIVGAYAAYSPSADTGESIILDALAARPIVGGLELPQVDHVVAHPSWRAEWSHVITCIPGTMGRIANDATFGLASPDEAGRNAALAFAAQARDDIAALREQGHHVQAIEFHSGPSNTADAEAMAASMATISGWDWGSEMVFLVEHGDATTPDHHGEKAFLTFEEELSLVEASANPRWKIGINWGRSALEGRGKDLPLSHIRRAAEAGVLGAVFFSSASGEHSDFGTWLDRHLPPAGLPFSPPGTLLGAEEITAALEAAGDDVIVGLKFGLRPDDLPVEERATQLGAIVDLFAELL